MNRTLEKEAENFMRKLVNSKFVNSKFVNSKLVNSKFVKTCDELIHWKADHFH
jgi:hypothetical protein